MDYKQEIEKVAFGNNAPLVSNNFQEDNSDRTSFMKDRVMPGIKSKGYGVAGALGGAAIGAGLGLAGKKATRATYKKLLSSDMSKRLGSSLGDAFQGSHELFSKGRKVGKILEEPAKMLFGPEMAKARSVMAAGAGAMAMTGTGKDVGKVMGNVNAVKKQYVNQFGVEPTEKDLVTAAKLNPEKNKTHKAMMDFFYTPNAMTKSQFREQQQIENLSNRVGDGNLPVEAYARDKMASDYKSEIEKTAIDLSAIQHTGKVIQKALPVVGGAAVGIGASIPSFMAADSSIHDDDKSRNLKVGGATLAGGALGTALGATIGKDVADVGVGVMNKIQHPSNALRQAGGMVKDTKFLTDRLINAGKVLVKGK